MKRIGRRVLTGSIAWALIGCVFKPAAAPPARPSPFEGLGDVCVCASQSARARVAYAIDRFAETPTYEAPADSVATCGAAFAGGPTAFPEPFAYEGPIAPLFARARGKLWLSETGALRGCAERSEPGLDSLLESLGAAIHEALLAGQACHATTLAIALDALVQTQHESASSLLARVETAAARAHTALAMAVAFSGAVSEVLRDGHVERIEAARRALAGLDLEGSFTSDGSSTFRHASRIRERYLSAAWDRTTYDRLRETRPDPVSVSGAPWLGLLLDMRAHPKTRAATRLLEGLARRDLGMLMTGAAPLYRANSDPARALAAGELMTAGQIGEAANVTRELVPFFTDAGRALAHLAGES